MFCIPWSRCYVITPYCAVGPPGRDRTASCQLPAVRFIGTEDGGGWGGGGQGTPAHGTAAAPGLCLCQLSSRRSRSRPRSAAPPAAVARRRACPVSAPSTPDQARLQSPQAVDASPQRWQADGSLWIYCRCGSQSRVARTVGHAHVVGACARPAVGRGARAATAEVGGSASSSALASQCHSCAAEELTLFVFAQLCVAGSALASSSPRTFRNVMAHACEREASEWLSRASTARAASVVIHQDDVSRRWCAGAAHASKTAPRWPSGL